MRLLKRTGASAMTRAGYARRNTTISVTDDEAKALLKEGGWEEVKAASQRQAQARRMTEVPTPSQPQQAASGAGSTPSGGQGGAETDPAATGERQQPEERKKAADGSGEGQKPSAKEEDDAKGKKDGKK